MKSFFITSSGTGIGKTLVTATLNHQLNAQGIKTLALKPVMCGFEPGEESDTAQLLLSGGLAHNAANAEMISPWRFAAPLSPNMAAELEGKQLSLDTLVSFCSKKRVADMVLVEGVGGIMVPLNDHHTTLDWMVALNWPVILVVGSYLGALSHALTAIEVLKQRGLFIQAVVVSESAQSSVDFVQTVSTLRKFIDGSTLLVPLPRVQPANEPWRHCADLRWMVHHD